MNTARTDDSSRDRTVRQYAEEIWNVAPVRVENAIAGARGIGLSATAAASAAANGALRGAGEIGGTAVEQVRDAATGVIAGVKVVAKEPFKGKGQERPSA